MLASPQYIYNERGIDYILVGTTIWVNFKHSQASQVTQTNCHIVPKIETQELNSGKE